MELPREELDQITTTLMEISQVTDWLAGLNAESQEVSNGLSCILVDVRDKADHLLNMLAYH